jgi:hypothetical protein
MWNQISVGATPQFGFQFTMAYIRRQGGCKPSVVSPPHPIFFLHLLFMPALGIDLNQQPDESGDLYPTDWDDIDEYDGPAHQLDYDMVWEDGNQGANLPRSLICLLLVLSMNLFFLFLCCRIR